MTLVKKIFIVLLLLMASTSAFSATSKTIQSHRILRVGITHFPPFTIIHGNNYSGISVEIWKRVANHLGLKYQFIVTGSNVDQNVDDLSKGLIDVLVGPVHMGFERSKKIEFTYPYAINNLAIVVPLVIKPLKDKLVLIIKNILSITVYLAILGFIIYIHTVWICERKKNEDIPHSYIRGISHLIWSSLLRRSIKMPTTLGGRLIEFFWICVCTLALSVIYGSVFSALHLYYEPVTLKLNPELDKISAVEGTVGYETAEQNGYVIVPVKSLSIGINKILNHEVSGYVGSVAMSFYYLRKHGLLEKINLSQDTLKRFTLNFGLPIGSPLTNKINIELSYLEEANIVQDICIKYLGKNLSSNVCL